MATEIAERPATVQEDAGKPDKHSHWLGWTALALSLAALASGMMPHFLFGEPLPNPFARRADPPAKAQAAPPHVVVNGDKAVDKMGGVEKVVEKAAQAKARVGNWAKGFRDKAPFLKGADQPQQVADALLPENMPAPQFDKIADVKAAAPVAAAIPPAAQPAINAPAAAVPDAPWTPGRTFLLSAVLLAIASLPVALASWIYEQQRPLPIAAVCCGTLAVTWQYLVVGIMIGLALAVFAYLFVKLIEHGG